MAATKGTSVNRDAAGVLTAPTINVKGLTSTAFEILNDATQTLWSVVIDNTANSAATYLKLWDNSGAPTVNTAPPQMVVPCAASTKCVVTSMQGLGQGTTNHAWLDANEISAICTSVKSSGNSGATATQTAPSTALDVDFNFAVT